MARVAVLGCGRWGQNHLKTLHSLRNEGIVDTVHAIDISEIARDASTHTCSRVLDGGTARQTWTGPSWTYIKPQWANSERDDGVGRR